VLWNYCRKYAEAKIEQIEAELEALHEKLYAFVRKATKKADEAEKQESNASLKEQNEDVHVKKPEEDKTADRTGSIFLPEGIVGGQPRANNVHVETVPDPAIITQPIEENDIIYIKDTGQFAYVRSVRREESLNQSWIDIGTMDGEIILKSAPPNTTIEIIG
jgi:hypothetical protein